MPRRVVITSTVRAAPPGTVGGYLRVLDLDREQVTFEAPIPESIYRAIDPNPRGGQRGGRGVSAHDARLVIGNAEHAFVFDRSWRLVSDFTHPLMANVHDLLAEERGLWITACGCDALLLVGWDGRLLDVWDFRRDERLVEEIGYPRTVPALDPAQDYRNPLSRGGPTHTAHVNSVARGSEGLLVLLGRVHRMLDESAQGESVVVRLHDGSGPLADVPAAIVDRAPAHSAPNHNVAEADGLLLLVDSNRSCLVARDAGSRAVQATVAIPGDPPFVRGLAQIGPGRWLVGSQNPLALHVVDLDAGRVVGRYPLGGVDHESVFAATVLPDDFADPPAPDPDDPYSFWKTSAVGIGFTPIPRSPADRRARGRA